ncbi:MULTISPECIES: 50S ribosomal protein L24 [Tenacibaculum]|uniref:Large ribosomal subunit protein uL24 n=2 Tax=Tenacibaculum TaxID=104267 RepID=A0AAE9SJH2_9FLAO|nr:MULTISPECIES: 50S ribosomal protein L24 [Tenacibaculum]GFD75333.1 50S ribosomal protein L24 [Tenacibaculum sp. KUL113]GFD80302.1 50S ribosomal protein L24 [Tenacibaculum sp. KUL118]GFD92271.1 50S ribosomal protein L24 [Alteromonas sp. KUL154]GFE02719.1 50S ribosomal protein L24 [Alteromonas sp. KUL156]AZJ31048.1 50S ribosomal protein L24 [Tenacibaculum mesophilum]
MKKFKIKSGDTVKVIAGDHKGSEGKVLQILKDKDRVVVEGVNMVSKHTKPSAANPQGGIVKKEAPLHISNVALIENGEAVRVGYDFDKESGKKFRVSKKSDKAI